MLKVNGIVFLPLVLALIEIPCVEFWIGTAFYAMYIITVFGNFCFWLVSQSSIHEPMSLLKEKQALFTVLASYAKCEEYSGCIFQNIL
jgi:hypothetical protein